MTNDHRRICSASGMAAFSMTPWWFYTITIKHLGTLMWRRQEQIFSFFNTILVNRRFDCFTIEKTVKSGTCWKNKPLKSIWSINSPTSDIPWINYNHQSTRTMVCPCILTNDASGGFLQRSAHTSCVLRFWILKDRGNARKYTRHVHWNLAPFCARV